MKRTYIQNIKERDNVDDLFLVKDKIMAMAKNGKPYMNLKLVDRTGEVEGKIWDDVDTLDAVFAKDDFIRIIAKASLYLGKMQLVVSSLKKVDDSTVDIADFLPVSTKSREEMLSELNSVVSAISDINLKSLMQLFLSDEPFMKLYCKAPAAKGMHHVFIGGLLEHSLSVAKLVDTVAPLYPVLNRDLLTVGALLHDAGKVREMQYARTFDYTTEGKLVGHITIGVEMISEKVRQIEGFPEIQALMLKHLILSHHGEYEYGSPKRPKILEAVVLNFLDDLDAKINGVTSHIAKDEQSGSDWTSYHKLYDRYFFKGGERTASTIDPPSTDSTIPESLKKPEKGHFSNNPFNSLKNDNLELF